MKLTSRITLGVLLLLITVPLDASAEEIKLITNRENFQQLTDVKEEALQHNVYDLSFVAYDEAFAEEFGLLGNHVTEMDEGLRFMEVRMVTEGAATNCYYNLVLDKSVKLGFPEEDYVANTSVKVIPTFPVDFDAPIENRKKLVPMRSLLNVEKNLSSEFRNRTYLGNKDYKHDVQGSRITGFVNYFLQSRPSLSGQLISMRVSCSFGTYVFQDGIPAIWLAKPTDIDFNITLNPTASLFHIFVIPNNLVKALSPYLEHYHKTEKILQRNKRKN